MNSETVTSRFPGKEPYTQAELDAERLVNQGVYVPIDARFATTEDTPSRPPLPYTTPQVGNRVSGGLPTSSRASDSDVELWDRRFVRGNQPSRGSRVGRKPEELTLEITNPHVANRVRSAVDSPALIAARAIARELRRQRRSNS